MTIALQQGQRVSGPMFPGTVEVVAISTTDATSSTVVFRTDAGTFGDVVIYADQYAQVITAPTGSTATFSSDANAWRLAAEALRIKYAALYDPMIAVTTSEVMPLPHQIRAVYGEMLQRTPLRFLLADDPGAGKTIMCGLYMKELLLRGDLDRALIVAPGSLVDQWQEELHLKFGLHFNILTNDLIKTSLTGNVFAEFPHMIARMDHLSRREDLQEQLQAVDFDLIVVDEAHRMSAHYYGQELKLTRRFELGRTLSENTRNLLLMTATPHAGKEEDYQAFLSLIDEDRFEGQAKKTHRKDDARDIMRRMVKEDLLTMDGKPLFPERRAYTTRYVLSPDEQALYEKVTEYVRTEMNRARKVAESGNKKLGNTVGFALTVLQRRLASSPEAILRSLERRKKRLEDAKAVVEEIAAGNAVTISEDLGKILSIVPTVDAEDLEDELDDMNADEAEEFEDSVMDAATAALTAEELDKEIEALGILVVLAQKVRNSETDAKWNELRAILDGDFTTTAGTKVIEKLIVFTEHKDTLRYLVERTRDYLGNPQAVVAIYGGTSREDRREIREQFTHHPGVKVLIATDAAGEGLNLQAAHMMVNYDLPWNPNRIEQRFGRIHRIGQREVCHLWNLVSVNTREGQVYDQLLTKLEQMRQAYSGKVFDVLGEAFEGHPLRNLMMDAALYGDDPAVKARLGQVIDATVGEGLKAILDEQALDTTTMSEGEVDAIRRRMDDARARRLQPHFVRDFFLTAFGEIGGRVAGREKERFEVTRVPSAVRERAKTIGSRMPVAERYERITFEIDAIEGVKRAELIAPGHPLLDAVVDLTIERNRKALADGAVLVDTTDTASSPRLLVAIQEEIHDLSVPSPMTVSKRFSFVEIDASGAALSVGAAPYLDYDAPTTGDYERAHQIDFGTWSNADPESTAKAWAASNSIKPELDRLQERATKLAARTRKLVSERLDGEALHWDTESMKIAHKRANGQRTKLSPEGAQKKAAELRERLEKRLAQIDASEHLAPKPARIAGVALVIPGAPVPVDSSAPSLARNTEQVDRRAVDAVLAAERALGREPEEMPHNNKGFDIRSVTPDGDTVIIEVKGRIQGGADFLITRSEILAAKNLGDDYRLALVSVSPDGAEHDVLCYVLHPFDKTQTDDLNITKFGFDWKAIWNTGGQPC